ncbi:LuxR C-terminal-related transcriptional regulator [Streptomyces sp. 900105755]
MISVNTLRRHVITAAEKHDLPLSIRQAEALANYLAVHANRGPAQTVRLTDVQFAALIGLASGEEAKETGRRLCRSEDTIKTHRRTLYKALGARSGAHAVAIAHELGLLRTSAARAGGVR